MANVLWKTDLADYARRGGVAPARPVGLLGQCRFEPPALTNG
jgi:hypothetical protein